MKKVYIKPSMRMERVEAETMLAASPTSIGINNSASNGLSGDSKREIIILEEEGW